jgi:hypothetical protein
MNESEVLKKLAETMDVKELLLQYPEIDKQDVEHSLRFGSDLIYENDNPVPVRISKLFSSYNGTMAGFFVGASIFFHVVAKDKEREEYTLKTIHDFLITFNHQFKENAKIKIENKNIEELVEQELRDHDNIIADYYLLGSAFFRVLIQLDTPKIDSEDIEEVKRLLSKLGHPTIIFEKATEKIGEVYSEGKPSWQDLMNTCLRFLRELIYTVDEEKETCFVALPFKEPFLERYLNFYRSIATNMKMLAFKAWGGLGNEKHQEMLLLLVAKCSAFLADVTEPNANVTMELGFALGQNKRVWLIADINEWETVSNVKMDWVYQYNVSEDKYWFINEADYATMYFTALENGRRPGPVPVWDKDPIEILYKLKDITEKVMNDKKNSD